MNMESRLVFTRWESGKRGTDGEVGVGRCRLLHLEWMGDEVLLYSTGNGIQSLGENEREKKKKKNRCGWAAMSLCCTAEIEGTL